MTMTKKDYEAIAGVLNKHARELDDNDSVFCNVVLDLADLFGSINDRFLPARFFEAVYVGVCKSSPAQHDFEIEMDGRCQNCGEWKIETADVCVVHGIDRCTICLPTPVHTIP